MNCDILTINLKLNHLNKLLPICEFKSVLEYNQSFGNMYRHPALCAP